MSEQEFMDRLREWSGWNDGLWLPWTQSEFASDRHGDIFRAMDELGAYYFGAPNGRIDDDDQLGDWMDHFEEAGRDLVTSPYCYR